MNGPAAVLDDQAPAQRSERRAAIERNEDHSGLERPDEPHIRSRVVADLDRAELNARDAETGRIACRGVPELVHDSGHDQREQRHADRHRQRRQQLEDALVHPRNAVRNAPCRGGRTRSTAARACWRGGGHRSRRCSVRAAAISGWNPAITPRRGSSSARSSIIPTSSAPFVTDLARRLAAHGVDSVCGPMTGGAKLAQLIAAELRIECFEAERLETPGATGMFPVKYELPADAAATERAAGRSRSSTMRSARAPPFAGRTRIWSRAARGPSRSAHSSCSATRRRASRLRAGLALEAIERLPLEMWIPPECPLCKAGVAIDAVSAG